MTVHKTKRLIYPGSLVSGRAGSQPRAFDFNIQLLNQNTDIHFGNCGWRRLRGKETRVRESCRWDATRTKGRDLQNVLTFLFFDLQIRVKFSLPLKDMFILNSRNYR